MIKCEVYTSNGFRYRIEAETFGEAKSSAEFMVERDTPEGESCKWRLFSRNLRKATPFYIFKNGIHRKLARA